jgi:hypothetical protein
MGSSQLLIWGLASGLVTNVVMTWSSDAWEYVPGIVFGATLAIYFAVDIARAHKFSRATILKLLVLLAISTVAYRLALNVADWMMVSVGFTTYASYSLPAAESALYAAFFIGSFIGSFLLTTVFRLLFFRFNFPYGMLILAIAAPILSTVIAVGFETFGFIPQFAIPVMNVGMAAIIAYLHDSEKSVEENPTQDIRAAVFLK